MPVKQNDSAHTHSEVQNELTGNMPVKQISHPQKNIEKIESQDGWEIADPQIPFEDGTFILYQGALNQGRGLERLLRILTRVNYPLLIVGKGDIENELKEFVQQYGMQNQVHFYGFVHPYQLPQITRKARIGYNVSENEGLSYYLSLNNKFFDYVEAGLPSVINDFPEYVHLNQEFGVGLNALLEDADIEEKLKILMENDQVYQKCVENCRKAREIWNWENESQSLIAFYQSIVSND
jgi:glycosyltransferase involved in cell wall biosynthesis